MLPAAGGRCHPGRPRRGTARCAPRPAQPGARVRGLRSVGREASASVVLVLAASAAPEALARRQEPPRRRPPLRQPPLVGVRDRGREDRRRATRGERGGIATSEGSPVIDHRIAVGTDDTLHHLRLRLRSRVSPAHLRRRATRRRARHECPTARNASACTTRVFAGLAGSKP